MLCRCSRHVEVAMHALGDVPSPPIVGALQGESSYYIRSTDRLHGMAQLDYLKEDFLGLLGSCLVVLLNI